MIPQLPHYNNIKINSSNSHIIMMDSPQTSCLNKYHSFITNTWNLGWNTQPLMVIIVGPHITTYMPSTQSLHQYQISILAIECIIFNINNIAIKYTTNILQYK